MSCNSKINSLEYLIKNGATDDIRKILDLSLFNELNNTLTEYAKTKYNLETGDEKLFSAGEQKSIYLKDTPYYRDSTYNIYRAIPNEALFTQLDILVSEYENRPDTDQPMFMKTPSVNYSLKIVETLGKINRGTFEMSKLQGWLNDLQKQGVSNQQLELFKEIAKPGMTKDEIAVAIAAAYSYTVEINTAKSGFEEIIGENEGYGFIYQGIEYNAFFNPGGDIEYEKDGEEISEREYVKARKEGKKEGEMMPTQIYSNLTVPGGTNYTEQEIATPEITPSIKGHAQFATDKGIGWFRSDDKGLPNNNFKDFNKEFDKAVDTKYKEYLSKGLSEEAALDKALSETPAIGGNESKFVSSKTRRILEIQSDLFQKGRDKDTLIFSFDTSRENNKRRLVLDNLSYDRALTSEEQKELDK